MAIQIDQQLTLSGITIPSGAYVDFTPTFQDRKRTDDQGNMVTDHLLLVTLFLYASKTAYDSGQDRIKGIPEEFGSMGIEKTLTDEEYANLNKKTVKVMSRVNEWIKEEIGKFEGIDPENLSIV